MSKEFDKYRNIGPDYHYRQIDRQSFRNFNAALEARYLALVKQVKTVAGDGKLKLLDVGCGDGVALYFIRQSLPNLELYGIDEAEEALAIAREKISDVQVEKAGAYKLPYPDKTFDIVISSDVIEHVENPDLMLREIKRVAKTNASIIIGTPVRRTKHPIDSQHVQEFFAEDFIELISRYFRNPTLHESHSLIPTLLYNAPTKSFVNFRYLINLLSIVFNYNPFLAERRNQSEMFAYMYIICKK